MELLTSQNVRYILLLTCNTYTGKNSKENFDLKFIISTLLFKFQLNYSDFIPHRTNI